MSNKQLDDTIKALEAKIKEEEEELKRLTDRQIELDREHEHASQRTRRQSLRMIFASQADLEAMEAYKKTSEIPKMNKESEVGIISGRHCQY